MKKIKRYTYAILITIVILIISNYTVRNTKISEFSIFEPANLLTYFGVLIGFALTIYTFGIAMISDIKGKIEELENVKPEKKEQMYSKLMSGFTEIKQDIWIIFYTLILVVVFVILKEFPNPFEFNFGKYMLPQTINVAVFTISTIAMFDIMKSLFNISEINLELLKNKIKK